MLLVMLVVAASPWVQRPLNDYYIEHHLFDDEVLTWFLQAMPSWEYSPHSYSNVLYLATNDLSALLLLAGIVIIPLWLPSLVPGWIRCIAGAVLASEFVLLPRWVAPELFGLDAADIRFSFVWLAALMRSGLIFGLVAGVLLALLTVGSAKSHVARSVDSEPATLGRRNEGGSA